jgi:hypothetical protein
MNVTLSLGPLVSLIAGILILVMPRLLNIIVALYLIIIGIIGIFGMGSTHFWAQARTAGRNVSPAAFRIRIPLWIGNARRATREMRMRCTFIAGVNSRT